MAIENTVSSIFVLRSSIVKSVFDSRLPDVWLRSGFLLAVLTSNFGSEVLMSTNLAIFLVF